MLRSFFSYVPSAPPPEEPETEPPDPNSNRALSEPYRSARRGLLALCAVCIAWSAAQFGLGELTVEGAGVVVDLKDASVPLLLGTALTYLTGRWVMEYAMMSRHVRRWRLAQLDFRTVSAVSRFSMLALAAGALDRSLRSVTAIVILLAVLALLTGVLTTALMLITMPVRMWARERAGRVSAASASYEAVVWALVFAVSLIVIGTIAVAVASYRYEPLRLAVWPVPPNPIALAVFVVTLNAVFLSHWLLQPLLSRLFGERPAYRTSRTEDGRLIYSWPNEPREPLL